MADQLPMFEGSNPEGSTGRDDEDRDKDLRTVELTSHEVSLLLEFGYPFRDEERKLRASKAIGGTHKVCLGAY